MDLGAADACGEGRPLRATPGQPQAGRIDQPHRLADPAPQAAPRLAHHLGEQAGEHRRRSARVGIGQRRARHLAGAEVIESRLVTRQRRLDLAQRHGPGELAVEQRHQLASRGQSPYPPVGLVLSHQPIEFRPRNMLQKPLQDAMVMPHGVEPLPVSRTPARCSEPSRINAMRPVQQNSTGQPWVKPGDDVLSGGRR
jgi:hypothetical protein